jgi:ribose transport system substrate-binding protein
VKRKCSVAVLMTAALLLAFALSACGSSKGTQGEGTESAEVVATQSRAWNKGGELQIPEPKPNSGKGVKIAVTSYGQDNPYSQYVFKAVQKEAERYGATATFVGPPTYEEQGQYEALTAIAQAKSYDAVVILPINGAQIVPAVEKLGEAGIYVAGNTEIIGPNPAAEAIQVKGMTTEEITPTRPNAEAMAEGIIKGCEGVSKCETEVIWGNRALDWEHVKLAPFNKKLEGHSNVDIVCQSDANFTQDEGRTQAADCLQAHPNLSVIATQSDESLRGAEPSIEAAGRTYGLGKEDIKMVGAYASRYGVKKVRNGEWLQTWYSRPQSLGIANVDLLLEAMEGQKVPTFVTQEELDDVGTTIDKEVLEKDPEIVGQWEG